MARAFKFKDLCVTDVHFPSTRTSPPSPKIMYDQRALRSIASFARLLARMRVDRHGTTSFPIGYPVMCHGYTTCSLFIYRSAETIATRGRSLCFIHVCVRRAELTIFEISQLTQLYRLSDLKYTKKKNDLLK